MAAAGNRRARVLERMLPRLNFYLSGAQLGITITSIGLGFVAQPYIAAVLSPLLENVFSPRTADGVALVLALALATVLQLVFAEVVPKNVAVSRPEATGLALAPAMRLLSALLGPVIRFLNATSVWLVRRLGVEPREELESIRSVDELELLIQTSAEQGSLGREATQLLTRSIRFGDKEAGEILVPRPDVVGVPVTRDRGRPGRGVPGVGLLPPTRLRRRPRRRLGRGPGQGRAEGGTGGSRHDAGHRPHAAGAGRAADGAARHAALGDARHRQAARPGRRRVRRHRGHPHPRGPARGDRRRDRGRARRARADPGRPSGPDRPRRWAQPRRAGRGRRTAPPRG